MIDRKIAPKVNSIEEISLLKPQFFELSNGVKLITLNAGEQEILKIDVQFNAGVWFQPKPLIAGAANTLIKSGTSTYTSEQIAEMIDNYGAFLATSLGYDKATVTLYTLNKHLENVLPTFYELIINAFYPEYEIDIYRNNNLQKFKINQEKVSFIANTNMLQNLFGENHPYGRKVEEKDFKRINRKEIYDFYKKYYNLNDCVIFVSGKVNEVEYRLISKYFEQKINSHQPPNNTSKKDPIIKTNKGLKLVEKDGALQSAISIGAIFPTNTHKDYFGLQVLNTILGGYFGSRLMSNIREDKGYTYGIGSGIKVMQNATYFTISTQVGVDVTQATLNEINKELEHLKKNEIGNDELSLVKNYMLGKFLKKCDGVFSQMELVNKMYNFNLPSDYYNNYIKTIKNINSNKILELANTYLKEGCFTTVVCGKI